MLRWKKSGRARSAGALSEATSQGRFTKPDLELERLASRGGEGEVAAAQRAAEETELGRLDVQSAQDPEAPDPVYRLEADEVVRARHAVPLELRQGLLDHRMVRYAHHPFVPFTRTARGEA
jgi:hypothetical protein